MIRDFLDFQRRYWWVSALIIVASGIAATLLSGLIFAWIPLASRPAQVLRGRE